MHTDRSSRLHDLFTDSRVLVCASMLMAVLVVGSHTAQRSQVVYISEEGGSRAVLSSQQPGAYHQNKQLLERQGITLREKDNLQVTRKSGCAQLLIQRAIQIPITCDGSQLTATLEAGTTARQALAACGITLGGQDMLSLPLDTVLHQGDSLQLQRVEERQQVETTVLPAPVQNVYTSVLPQGQVLVRQYGSDGAQQTVTDIRYVDGQETQRTTGTPQLLYQPTPQIQLIGQPGAAVSELDFDDLQLDENGVPRNYSRVQRGAKTTGYSVRPGQGTASGRAPVPGIVAVDPRKIPYGTRMYIRSADGQFVYGCAIAGETGTAMTEGRVDLDLLYGSYQESCYHGVRAVDIYFLD